MSTSTPTHPLDFVLDPAHEAHEPLEASGRRRDHGRLLVSRGTAPPVDARFDAIGTFLAPGDLVVVNTSATLPAALDGRLPDGEPIVVHLSGELPGGVALVEVRRPGDGTTAPLRLDLDGTTAPVVIDLFGGGRVQLLTPFADSTRLWVAKVSIMPTTAEYLARHGRPIRYRHVPHAWPVDAYQTVFADEPGSAEMPSASRPFTPELVTTLVTRGIHFAPLVLHTGVSSLEGGERPYPERYRVPRDTAAMINAVRAAGGQVVAAGTTVVRALATVTDDHGEVHPGVGWTDVVVPPATPRRAVDGLLTGWHEPESTHLWMLEAFADREVLAAAYATALDLGYRWHEFGDSHLILRERAVR
jgi:S-adenosylmethionine:tRNA ribosyltransferase-isomerase